MRGSSRKLRLPLLLLLALPSGLLGAGRASAGAGAKPNGAGAEPNGTGAEPDGTGAKPDGTGAKPDGTGAKPDGTAAKPDGTAAAPPEMLKVPGGTFTMGADRMGELDEQPAHQVTVQTFWLDRTEVTNASYLECVHAGKCAPYRDNVARSFGAGPESGFRGADQPVVGVSFVDASGYCAFRHKRLPHEAEWERAARGDDARTYAWGNQPPTFELACYGRKPGAPGATTDPVGSHPAGAGPYGHLDLTGNVWEWTADYYDPYAYRRPGAPEGVPGSCSEILQTQDQLRKSKRQGFTGSNPIPRVCERVLRGGAFNYHASGLRASNRVHHPETFRMLVAGFRCAKDG